MCVLNAAGGKLEVWDPAAVSSPVCSVLANDAAIVHIVVCGRITFHSAEYKR